MTDSPDVVDAKGITPDTTTQSASKSPSPVSSKDSISFIPEVDGSKNPVARKTSQSKVKSKTANEPADENKTPVRHETKESPSPKQKAPAPSSQSREPAKTQPKADAKSEKNSATKKSDLKRNKRPQPRMSNARFSDKVFQNSSEALSRALVRKEQRAILENVLDADEPIRTIPVVHKKDASIPPQVMKNPKVPPETRPGRAAMFGNIPLDPLQYEPRHKSEDFSKAYIRERVFLDSDQAQRLFENCYDEVNVSFSIMTTVLRRFDKPAFLTAEKKINADITQIQDHYRKGLTDVATSLNECVKEENRRVAYHDHEREYTVPIHTPYSLRFITCVTLFDKYVSRLNAALITGIIDYDSFDACLKAASGILQNFRHEVVMMRHSLIRDLRSRSGRKTEVARAEQIAEHSARQEKVETTDPHPTSKNATEKKEV